MVHFPVSFYIDHGLIKFTALVFRHSYVLQKLSEFNIAKFHHYPTISFFRLTHDTIESFFEEEIIRKILTIALRSIWYTETSIV